MKYLLQKPKLMQPNYLGNKLYKICTCHATHVTKSRAYICDNLVTARYIIKCRKITRKQQGRPDESITITQV